MSTPLERALGRLVADGTISGEQATAIAVAVATEPLGEHPRADLRPDRSGWTGLLPEIGGYVGGVFVLAAAVVLTGPRWGDFGTAARLAILGVPALVLVAAAASILAATPGGWPVHHRRGAGPRRRLSAALLLVAAGLAGGVAAVLAGSTSTWQGVAFFGAATVASGLGYAVLRTSLLHVGTAAAATSFAPFLVTQWTSAWTWEQFWAGVAILAVAAVWLALTGVGALAETGLGLTVAGGLGFLGAEVVATSGRHGWAGYLVLATVAAAGLVGYVRTHHVGVLVVGVVALATVVPQAVIDYTDGALGAAGALLLTGLSILGASVVGLRLRGRGTPAAGPMPPAAVA